MNTLSAVNSIPTCEGWQFQGVPFSFWPECYYVAVPSGTYVQADAFPLQVVVLNGSYTPQELQSAANVTFNYPLCLEWVHVVKIIFYPNSDSLRLVGVYSATQSNVTYGDYQLQFSFVTDGYWNLKQLASSQNPSIGPPATSTTFTPGQYTIAVEDEWGQAVLLHFSVT